MSFNKFDFLVDRLSKGASIHKQNKIYISDTDINYLSKFEKNLLTAIAKLRGILINPDLDFSYEELMQTLSVLIKGKGDYERTYLLSLFFPEKIRNAQAMLPFPIPCATYIQKYQLYVTPNEKGCFLLQYACPALIDGSAAAGVSNLWVNTDATLDGVTLIAGSTFTPITVQRPPGGAFNSFVLQAAKISCRYVGRYDIISGYFGASQHISVVNTLSPDPATTQFNYVDDSLNATVVDISDTINVIY